MKKPSVKSALLLVLYLVCSLVYSFPVNNIEKDPWMRSWLILGPFDSYEVAKGKVDSLYNIPIKQIENFLSQNPSINHYLVNSDAENGILNLKQLFHSENNQYIIGFSIIKTENDMQVEFAQDIVFWENNGFHKIAQSLFINGEAITEKNNQTWTFYPKDFLRKGSHTSAFISQLNGYTTFGMGLFNR